MPLNTIYRSSVGIWNGRRFYFEIIPRSTSLYSTPNIEEFPLASINQDWKVELNTNDDRIGVKRPDGMNITIDLEMLSSDLKSYILNPFINYNISEDFPTKYDTFLDIPNFDLTNVWLIKTDELDSELALDDFPILYKFGMKKNPEVIFKIRKDGIIQKNKVDLVLHDIFRIITDSIHPIYFTWLALDDVENNTRLTPKTVARVYDFAYKTQSAKSDYYNVKVLKENTTATLPTSTTVDGVTLSIGDKMLFSHTNDEFVYILELVSDSPVEYQIIRKAGPFGDIKSGEIFYVESGTNSDKNFVVNNYTAIGGIGIKARYDVQEVSVDIGVSRVIAKFDGGYVGTVAYYINIIAFNTYFKYIFDYFYKKLMRVDNTDTNYVLTIKRDLMYAFTLYKQSYDKEYSQGSPLLSTELYFCALVESNGVIYSGYLAENDGGFGIYEYENAWDLLENIKGQVISASYYSADKGYHLTFDRMAGYILHDDSSSHLYLADIQRENTDVFEVRVNTETKRGVIVNINVQGDNRNEHKYIRGGSISEDELSIKAMFHNNPSIELADDGWIETNEHPELKSSLDHTVARNKQSEIPFDIHKLVYFDTPSEIADSEMAIRPHSHCAISALSENTLYWLNPVSKLPVDNDPWSRLKYEVINLQKYSGTPYFTARKMEGVFNSNNRAVITIKVPIDKIIDDPINNRILLDFTDLLIEGSEPALGDNWYINSIKATGESEFATVEIIGRY